ncbi:MAG: hypothetical protein Ta2F_01540 [Termitinemataceae bacterium]|nr:MAG: hypothetical protein Ta2F_01540 [Termitinemataceae bacterium]
MIRLSSIINKKVSPACAIILVAVFFAVTLVFVSLMAAAVINKETPAAWEDLGIISAAEEDALASEQKAAGIAPVTKRTISESQYISEESAQRLSLQVDGYSVASIVPIENESAWTSWMVSNRPDDREFLPKRWQLAWSFIASGELKRLDDLRAFLLTPRENFVRAQNKGKEYADTWLPIGWGATITDPDVVAMMTTTLNVQPNDKILEIGTGSGYQAAILSCLSSRIYTIEIIQQLYFETDALYSGMEAKYPMYKSIRRITGDGYYGWEGEAPFDKIIVTCSIDHIPPPLLQQLQVGGIMVLPLGVPGRQYIMEIKKSVNADGTITLKRRDVYNGLRVSFIPFRNESGSSYSRTN